MLLLEDGFELVWRTDFVSAVKPTHSLLLTRRHSQSNCWPGSTVFPVSLSLGHMHFKQHIKLINIQSFSFIWWELHSCNFTDFQNNNF
jgi:hypothetical protein